MSKSISTSTSDSDSASTSTSVSDSDSASLSKSTSTSTSDSDSTSASLSKSTSTSTSAITIPDYPTDGDQPTITIDDPTQIPNGTEEGTVNVGVTVTYPDGSTDKLTVPVVTGKQADNLPGWRNWQTHRT
ncbi:Rib/alpha-like domain-containing protein [Staphylococcus pseudintermedius]|nr:Rib/alpha-like domain-containing protein [Staphylococcus pseudintermedius]WMZ59701.1 Rib/alpha-like domain-containing protein [Staphylococcus pseudintermedius]